MLTKRSFTIPTPKKFNETLGHEADILHTKSGISFDFICENRGGARDYILKDLLKGVSTEDLIRGEVFVKTYTYLNKEGDISQVEIESLQTDELIDSRNDFDGGFMDELSTIHVSEGGLAKVRAGAKASEVLIEEEIEQINDLVRESLNLSYYYSDEESLYEFEDADFEIENYVVSDETSSESCSDPTESK